MTLIDILILLVVGVILFVAFFPPYRGRSQQKPDSCKHGDCL
jgi:hypothetical protein